MNSNSSFRALFIVLAVNQDAHGVDKRAALFKATTWEEVNMLAQTDSYIESAAESIYSSVTDLAILDILRVRQEEIDGDIHRRERLAEMEKLLVEKKTLLAEQSKQINELKNRLKSNSDL